jgi:hypothetical protein
VHVGLSGGREYGLTAEIGIQFTIHRQPRFTYAGKPPTYLSMPRGNPHKQVMLRLDRALEAEVRVLAGPRGFSAAVTEGLRWWLAREKRRAASAPPAQRKRKAA